MVKIAMLGSGFIGRFYADSILGQRSQDKVISIYARREESAKKFAADYGCSHWATDMEKVIAHPEVDVVCIALPNNLHEAAVMLCCKHKKAVITTKPLGRNAAEAKRMLEAVEAAGIFNGYLEDLVYTPKFLKAYDSVKNGALGRILWAKSRETHPGPHSEWFWDVNHSGGGALMDLGCHGIAFCYWFLGRPAIKSVYCQMGTYVHRDKSQAEDDSLCILEFANGAIGLIENSWARRGGMDDRIEVFGSEGVTYGNLHMGNALPTYSENGYGYAVEKAPTTRGWTYPVFEELWNYGTPQELRHFARCVRGKETPQSTGEDGLVVLHALYAGYASAGEGRKITLPFDAPQVKRPIDLWLNGCARKRAIA